MIGLLLVGCSVSLGQPINMVFMLMDDVSLTSKEEGGGREEEEGQGERESEGVRGKRGGEEGSGESSITLACMSAQKPFFLS